MPQTYENMEDIDDQTESSAAQADLKSSRFRVQEYTENGKQE